MKWLRIALITVFTVHFLCIFLSSIDVLKIVDHKYTQIAYVDSFFRQGWSFFAPDPVLSNTIIEYKCLSSEKIHAWKNFEKSLTENLSPWTFIFPSSNISYLADSLGNQLMFGTSKKANEFCSNGDCYQYFSEISRFSEYRQLKKIVMDLCLSELNSASEKAFASRIRVSSYNLSFFSKRAKNIQKHVDLIELPIHEF